MFSKQGFITVCLVILTALLITGCLFTTPIAVTGVTLDQATMTLTAGGATGTLVATVAPANATNQSVTWFSSAPAVATVANGVVTPLTAGTTTITVTTVDGGFTATCAVTVNPASVAIGDSYGGGIVAYVDGTGQHGLIAATEDQSAGIDWITGGGTQSEWVNGDDYGGTSTDYGTGQANTNAMKAQTGYTGGAAKVCDDYWITVGSVTYTDWFLPSKEELNLMYANLHDQTPSIGGFGNFYWSSSEFSAYYARYQYFGSSVSSQYGYDSKDSTYQVRAVRAF